MPLVVDGVSVVIPNAIIEDRFPGGMAAYRQLGPPAAFCTDGRICRVAFASEADARAFVDELTRRGVATSPLGQCSDVALVALHVTFLHPCEWLDLDIRPVASADGRRYPVPVVRLRDDQSAHVAVPVGWQPGPLHRLTPADAVSRFELVESRRDDAALVETYRNRETGRLVRITKPVT